MRRPVAVGVTALAVLGACGGNGDEEASNADQRADQARQVAEDAGLGAEVEDFLALAAAASGQTFSVTYPAAGDQGGTVVVTQQPPNRRVDVATPDGEVVESRFLLDQRGYACGRGEEGWECQETAGDGAVGTAFGDDIVAGVTEALRTAADDYTFAVEARDLLGVAARCLVTMPKPGSDGAEAGAGTLCLSPEGAPLLVERPSETLAAEAYRPTPPAGAFELPAEPGPPSEDDDPASSTSAPGIP